MKNARVSPPYKQESSFRCLPTILIILFVLIVIFVILYIVILKAIHNATLRGHKTAMASMVYALDNCANNNGDRYPVREEWPEILIDDGYIEREMIEYTDIDRDGLAYLYPVTGTVRGQRTILLYEDPKHWDEGVIVGFADNKVELLDHAVFERMLAEQLASQVTEP